MDSKIYYNQRDNGLLITSNIEKYKRNIALKVYPDIDFEEISIENIGKYKPKNIGFDEIDNEYFQSIKEIFSKYQFNVIAFHETTVDLTDIVIDIEHLIIGDKSKINLYEKNFKNLKEITFLSVKTFKGKILDQFNDVKKLILWYENKKSNEILRKCPKLKEFWINNGSVVDLDISENPMLEILELHRCVKLEKVIVASENSLKKVSVESSNKLDISNFLHMNIEIRRW